jgi:hypothetical protein
MTMKRQRDDDDEEGEFRVDIQWPSAVRNPAIPDPPSPVTLAGRPAFTTAAKKIKLVRTSDRSYLEDRRHLVHWAEHLRPMMAEVFSALVLQLRTPPALLKFLNERIALFNANNQALPKDRRLNAQTKTRSDVDTLILFIAARLNAMVENLIPDRADINLAIEHVRTDVRRYMKAVEDREVDALAANQPMQGNAGRMAAYLALAEEVFEQKLPVAERAANLTRVYGPGDKYSMTDRRREINALILEHIAGCRSPDELVMLLQSIVQSVTFDLSAKAQREQTEHALAWLNRMRTNGAKTAEQRFDDMLAFIR